MRAELNILVAGLACLAGVACAGEAGAETGVAAVRIGLSPNAARKAERAEKSALFRRAAGGDADARAAWAAVEAGLRVSILAETALRTQTGLGRRQALRELARLTPSEDSGAEGLQALACVAVAEGDGALRELARKALAARHDERTVPLLARALASDNDLFRANAVATLKAIGGPPVFEVIIEHWKEVWGPGPRTSVFFGTVRSYIADYDISGDAYDPVVRAFYTGVVLDTKILRVERDVWYVWIRELAPGVELPNDPASWEKWLKDETPRLAKDAEKLQSDAANHLAALKDE